MRNAKAYHRDRAWEIQERGFIRELAIIPLKQTLQRTGKLLHPNIVMHSGRMSVNGSFLHGSEFGNKVDGNHPHRGGSHTGVTSANDRLAPRRHSLVSCLPPSTHPSSLSCVGPDVVLWHGD